MQREADAHLRQELGVRMLRNLNTFP
jgi:hypothetical protein